MVQYIVCDRCGKKNESEEMYEIYFVVLKGNEYKSRDHSDLCPECYEKVKAWLKEKSPSKAVRGKE